MMISIALAAAAGAAQPPVPMPIPMPPPIQRIEAPPAAGPAMAVQLGGEIAADELPSRLVSVYVRYIVGTNGRVAECTSLSYVPDPAVDPLVCRLVMERFRFSPARDSAGNPVAETRIEAIRPVRPPVHVPMVADGAAPPPALPREVPAPAAMPSLDPELERYLSIEGARPARLRSGTIADYDYPAAAIRAEAQGVVTIRFIIATDGRVGACTIAQSSGFRPLDDTSCLLHIRRIRFYPAHDENGNPVESTATRRIAWILPYEGPTPPPPDPAEPADP
jgi:protein TonB